MSAAADNVLRKLSKEWLIATTQREAVIAHGNATKQSPPDGYWQAERKARMMAQAALALAEETRDLP
jgi:hypothetical protein